jgi:hypothetical protein
VLTDSILPERESAIFADSLSGKILSVSTLTAAISFLQEEG